MEIFIAQNTLEVVNNDALHGIRLIDWEVKEEMKEGRKEKLIKIFQLT